MNISKTQYMRKKGITMKIKVFISKSGKKCVALCYQTAFKEYLLSFDIGTICDVADMTPSQVSKLEIGYYDI